MLERIKSNFTESIQTKIAASEVLSGPIEHAGMIMVQALLAGNKILACVMVALLVMHSTFRQNY